MKRFICLFLALFLMLPVFTVFSFAEERAIATTNKDEAVDQGFLARFDSDQIDTLIENAGSYEQDFIVTGATKRDVNTLSYGTNYLDFLFNIYVFNPGKKEFNYKFSAYNTQSTQKVAAEVEYAIYSGDTEIETFTTRNVFYYSKSDVDKNIAMSGGYEGMIVTKNPMFLTFYFSPETTEINLTAEQLKDFQIVLKSFAFIPTLGDYRNPNKYESDLENADFSSEEALHYSNLNYKLLEYNYVENRIAYSSPEEDLIDFLNLDTVKYADPISYQFPLQADDKEGAEVVFLHRSSKTGSLYVYIYDPLARDLTGKTLSIFLSIDGAGRQSYQGKFVRRSKTLTKFEIKDIKPFNSILSDYFICNGVCPNSDLSAMDKEGFPKVDDWHWFELSIEEAPAPATMALNNSPELVGGQSASNEILYKISSMRVSIGRVEEMYYQLNSSINGNNHFQTLSSVYFSLPAEALLVDGESSDLVKRDDFYDDRKITSVKISYDKIESGYGVITTDKDIYYNLINDMNSKDPDDLIAFGNFSFEISSMMPNVYRFEYSNLPSYSKGHAYDAHEIVVSNVVPIDFVLKYENVNGYFDTLKAKEEGEVIFSGEEFWNFYDFYKTSLNADKTNFTSTPISITINDEGEKSFLELLSKKEWTFLDAVGNDGLLAAIWGSLFSNKDIDDSIKDIKMLNVWTPAYIEHLIDFYNLSAGDVVNPRKVEGGIVSDRSAFCEAYTIHSKDYENFYNAMLNAKKNNEVFVFLRYDVSDYYCSEAFYDGNGSTTSSFVDNEDFFSNEEIANTLVVKNFKASNFDVLKINVMHDNVVCVKTVDMEPQDLHGPDTSYLKAPPFGDPEKDINNIVSGIGDAFSKFFGGGKNNDSRNWWEALLEFLKNAGKIIGAVLLVVLVVIFWGPISAVLSIVALGLKFVLSFIKGIFEFLYNLIFKRRDNDENKRE